MSGQRRHLLIIDVDEDILLILQQLLEDAGFDTTITWDETEARYLVERKPYDLIVVGDHPPELMAETVLRDFTSRGSNQPSLILGGNGSVTASPHLRKLGVIGIVSKREPRQVVEQVRQHLVASAGATTPGDSRVA